MMKKQTVSRFVSALLAFCMLFLTACGNVSNVEENGILNAGSGNTSATNPNGNSNQEHTAEDGLPTGEYNEGVVLVKYNGEMNDNVLSQLDFKSATPLYEGSSWYSVEIRDASKTVETVSYLRELGCFEKVDYDYVMGTTENGEAKVTDNPNYKDQTNLGLSNIPNGWTHNGKHPGGSADVIVAVIDTGVDYTHLDLRNNIWVNSAEIPDNGKDDDGNGYIDDVYGWDFVGNDNDPMDDNGHGTHVAGIIAAENNKIGGVGVAYGCKVMVLKAGNSSGYFNNSDIARAIQYAYMNGASVINMSFGGSQISVAVEEALENAYNTCVLVAAAGNDGACNNLSCKNPNCVVKKVSYPAALPYVIGVMSTNASGSAQSSFSNYDHYPYNSIEYEVYAVGESVHSTWPGNKYAQLNGTSMAAPTVAGIAALLRSMYPDRETYSTKFLQSQIVNTGKVCLDAAHSVADVYEALTRVPKPEVNLYGYTIDDSVSISPNNNGNGVIDAGETIRLYISLQNRGGVATNVNVSINAERNTGIFDPYFTFVNPTIQLSDIGTYSVRESGDKYFEIIVANNCPNDYLTDFNILFTYTNGLDDKDKTAYAGDGVAQFNVSSGYHLPRFITEDTVFTNDRLYIVDENVSILQGVTVTFEEGCHIQFYADRTYYDSPKISVSGTLIMEGTKDNMITLAPSERYSAYGCIIENYGSVSLNYVNAMNLYVTGSAGDSIVDNSVLREGSSVDYYRDGKRVGVHYISIDIDELNNSYVEFIAYAVSANIGKMSGNYIQIAAQNMGAGTINTRLRCYNFTNNIVFSIELKRSYATSAISLSGNVSNNLFLAKDDTSVFSLAELIFYSGDISNNAFSTGYKNNAHHVISGCSDVNSSCADVSALYPHIVSVEIFNKDGEQVTTIGKEEIKVRVTFNRPMDTEKNAGVFFGSREPYADYKIDGAFVSDTVWEGTYSLKAYIENGLQKLIVKNACAAEDATKTVHGECQLYKFNIDTTAAMAMNLIANATNNGIELTWSQDDYDTLMGYNIYRATSKDGNYVKINPSVLLSTDSSFVDTNAEPGVTYWYTFTVVLSDFSESAPAGKVSCTAIDTLNPTVYHTPVNQGYQNNNLVISCTASDNIKIDKVTLYYRTTGTTDWKTLTMSKVNDKYSATVFGSELDLAGFEYYIVASDGVNSISKGSADAPYFIIIKDASAISRIGDVDGNGVVDTKDALMIMQCLNGDLIMTDDEFRRADLNGDDELSSVEALRILQYINGNVSSLDM